MASIADTVGFLPGMTGQGVDAPPVRLPGLSLEEQKMVEGSWPLELLQDPLRSPVYVSTAEEFLREVLVSEHLGNFIILPNGCELLGLHEEDVMPSDLMEILRESTSVESFLRRLDADEKVLSRYKAGLEYIDKKGEQRLALPKERRNLAGRIKEILRLVDSKEADPQSLYIAELRLLQDKKHPYNGEKIKTVCRRDVKDILGPLATWSLYWDRHDEGVFIGNKFSGKGVHVDQVLWSNVGKNWRGYKLVAAWPKGAVSNRICRSFDDQLFSPPLSEAKLAALREAVKVVLLRPGDVYFFSGGTAHTALCVSEGMGLSAYESIVTLHPLHSGLMMQTCDPKSPCWLEGAMPEEEFEDILEEAAEQLATAASQLFRGGIALVGETEMRKQVPEAEEPFEVPQLWLDLRTKLCRDKALIDLLKEHFSATVALCSTRSRYMRRELMKYEDVQQAQKFLIRGRGFSSFSPSKSRSRSPRVELHGRRAPCRGAAKAKEIPAEQAVFQ